ncbi:MAG: substrate-binding protein [Chloroflexi bacterium]|nr:substrate-binding protein [Chloroflexota bacterium]
MTTSPIKVGLVAELTGPLSFMGIADANVTRMVVDDINADGGLLGRQLQLYVEDGETNDAVAEAKAAKLVNEDRVDVIFGGIYSSTRQAITRSAVTKGGKLYLYPEQYEGQERDPLVFCTGPVPAQQVEPLIPWLMQETGATAFYLPSADYIWPHVLNESVRRVVRANGGKIVGEEYFPLDHADYRATVEAIMASGADVVFNTIVPPGLTPFLQQLHEAGFTRRGGKIVCTYFDENFLNLVPAEHVEGLYSCLDYYQCVSDPFSVRLLARYNERFPGSAAFTAGSGCSGHYRALKLWQAAVTEAGSLDQRTVIAALDHAKLAEGPGGPAEMVPGQHHVRLNMYIAQAQDGNFRIVRNLGVIDPNEPRPRHGHESVG